MTNVQNSITKNFKIDLDISKRTQTSNPTINKIKGTESEQPQIEEMGLFGPSKKDGVRALEAAGITGIEKSQISSVEEVKKKYSEEKGALNKIIITLKNGTVITIGKETNVIEKISNGTITYNDILPHDESVIPNYLDGGRTSITDIKVLDDGRIRIDTSEDMTYYFQGDTSTGKIDFHVDLITVFIPKESGTVMLDISDNEQFKQIIDNVSKWNGVITNILNDKDGHLYITYKKWGGLGENDYTLEYYAVNYE